MYDQVVENCDCVDEETECSEARVQGEERIQQVLSVAGNTSEEFAIGIIINVFQMAKEVFTNDLFRKSAIENNLLVQRNFL